jgi:hypothetical protein
MHRHVADQEDRPFVLVDCIWHERSERIPWHAAAQDSAPIVRDHEESVQHAQG